MVVLVIGVSAVVVVLVIGVSAVVVGRSGSFINEIVIGAIAL